MYSFPKFQIAYVELDLNLQFVSNMIVVYEAQGQWPYIPGFLFPSQAHLALDPALHQEG
jgi:hypothetical protein